MADLLIDKQLYEWLEGLHLIVHTEASELKVTPKGQIEIREEDLARDILAGVIHKHLLLRLAEMNPGNQGGGTPSVVRDLEGVSESTSEPAKLANWNKLIQVLNVFPGVNITKSSIDELMKGNNKIAIDVISQIHSICTYKGKNIYLLKNQNGLPNSPNRPLGKSTTGGKGFNTTSEQSEPQKNRLDISPLYPQERTLLIQNLSAQSGFGECTNCLDFFCLAMAKETSVKPFQIVPLFNDDGMNWNNLIIKGKNGDQRPILNFYKNVISNISTLHQLVKIEELEGSVEFTLEALKPGLLSKDLRIAVLACSSFTKILSELADRKNLEPAWKFFKRVYGGFLAVLGCFDTFGDKVLAEVFLVLREIGKYAQLKMFKEEFRRMLPDPAAYSGFLNHILNVYLSKEDFTEELIKNGVIDYISRYVINGLENPNQKNTDTSLMAHTELACRLIASLPSYFSTQKNITTQIFTLFKQTSISSPLLFISSLNQFSALLNALAKIKSPLSPQTFKLLCQLHKASLGSDSLRQFANKTMTEILREIRTLPAEIVAQVLFTFTIESGDDENMDLDGFELLEECILHPSIDMENAIKIVHQLGEVVQISRYQPTVWGMILRNLTNRFAEDAPVCDEIKRMVANLLTLVYKKEIELSKLQRGAIQLREDNGPKETILRFSVMNAIKSVIEGKSQIINSSLPNILLFANRQIRMATNKNHRGIIVLLSFLVGDPERLLREYDQKQTQMGEVRKEMGIGEFKNDIHNLSGTYEIKEDDKKGKAAGDQKLKDSMGDELPPISISPLANKKSKLNSPTKKANRKPQQSKFAQGNGDEGNIEVIRSRDDLRKDSNDKMEDTDEETQMDRAKSATNLPGYLRGTEPDNLPRRMKYFDMLKEQEIIKKIHQEEQAIKFAKRAKEIKDQLNKYGRPVSTSTFALPKRDLEKEKKKEEDVMKEEKRRERHTELKKNITNYQQEKSQKQDEKKQEHQKKIEQHMKDKLKESKKFVREKVKEMKEKNRAIIFMNLLREQFENKRSELRVNVSSKQLEKIQNNMKGIRERINNEKETRDYITNLMNSQGVKMIMKEYQSSLETLFDFFCKIDPEPRNNGVIYSENRIQCRTFFQFLNIFNIVPGIIETESVQAMYRDTIKGQTINWKDKDGLAHEIPVGLTFKQFEEILLRINLKKKPVFDKVAYDNKSDEMKIKYQVKSEYIDFEKPEFFGKEDRKNLENVQDTYDMKDYHFTSFDYFMNYFRLPRSKDDIIKKLNFMRKDYLTRVKPADLKQRPKSMIFSKLNKKNEAFRIRKMEDALSHLFTEASVTKNLNERAQSAMKARDEVLEKIDKEKIEKKEKQKREKESSLISSSGNFGGTIIEKKTLIEEKEENEKKNQKGLKKQPSNISVQEKDTEKGKDKKEEKEKKDKKDKKDKKVKEEEVPEDNKEKEKKKSKSKTSIDDEEEKDKKPKKSKKEISVKDDEEGIKESKKKSKKKVD